MPNDTVTMLGPDGGTYLVPKANHAAALQSGMKTAPLAQQAMPPQPSLSMRRQEFLRRRAPNLTSEAIGEANKTAAMTGAALLPIGGTEGAAITKGIPWAARQAATRLPSAYAGYEGGTRAAEKLPKSLGVPPVVGGVAGATAGFFAPELVKGAVDRSVPLVEKLGAAWRGEGAKAAAEPVATLAGKVAGVSEPSIRVPEPRGPVEGAQWSSPRADTAAATQRGSRAAFEVERRLGKPMVIEPESYPPPRPSLNTQVSDFATEQAAPQENQVAELRQMQNNQALRNMRKQNALKTFSGALEEGRKHAKATGEIK